MKKREGKTGNQGERKKGEVYKKERAKIYQDEVIKKEGRRGKEKKKTDFPYPLLFLQR